MLKKTHDFVAAQQKMDYCIAAGMQFAAGDQCQVCVGHFFSILTGCVLRICHHLELHAGIICRFVLMEVGGATMLL